MLGVSELSTRETLTSPVTLAWAHSLFFCRMHGKPRGSDFCFKMVLALMRTPGLSAISQQVPLMRSPDT